MKRKYNWKTIEEFFRKELETTNNIMTFGTIGSLNLDNDLDIITSKKPESSLFDYQKEIHAILDNLDNFLRNKYGQKMIRFARFSQQKEVLCLGGYQQGDLALHAIHYLNLEQLKEHWKISLKKGEKTEDIIVHKYKPIMGCTNDFFREDFQSKRTYDCLAMEMFFQDRTNSNYSEDFLLDAMNYSFMYIQKHLGIKENMQANNKEQVREVYYKILDIIDKKSNEEQ